MIALVKQRRFQVVVIDSSQYMGLSYPDFQRLRRELPSKVLVIVSQVNESGNPYGGNKTKHACDVKVNIVDGRAEYRSRYNPEGYATVQLFTPKKKAKPTQTTLFT